MMPSNLFTNIASVLAIALVSFMLFFLALSFTKSYNERAGTGEEIYEYRKCSMGRMYIVFESSKGLAALPAVDGTNQPIICNRERP